MASCLKNIIYFIMVLLISACQSMDEKHLTPSDQNVQTHSRLILSLLAEIEKHGGLALTSDDEHYAQQVLEMNYTKQPSTWQVGRGKEISLTMIPVRTYQQNNGTHCRNYSVKIMQITTNETACRYGLNQWKVLNKQKEVTVKQETAIKSNSLEDEVVSTIAIEPSSSSTGKLTEVQQYFLSLTEQEEQADKGTISKSKDPLVNKTSVSWIIQVASFSRKDNAIRLLSRLEKQGYEPYITEMADKKAIIYRVAINTQGSQNFADEVVDKLKSEFKLNPLLYRNKALP